MPYRRLFVFCEGNDDERFFRSVLQPTLGKTFREIRVVRTAQMPDDKIQSYARNAPKLGADLILLRDRDETPSVRDRVETVFKKYDGAVPYQNIFIVVIEIESWYAAGLDRQTSEPLFGRPLQRTDHLTKERFNVLRPESEPRASFLQLILENFSVDRARTKNHSFDYFCTHVLDVPVEKNDIFAGRAE